MTLDEKKEKASHLLGGIEIDWYEEDIGRLACPGKILHTTVTKPGHTILYLDGVPTIYCWHASCADMVADANHALRHELCEELTPEERAARKSKSSHLSQASCDARFLLERKDWLLKNYAWPELFGKPATPAGSFSLFMDRMWSPEDIVWIGECWDTGPVKGPGSFKSAAEWLQAPPNLYAKHYTTTATFKPNTLDRVGAQVLSSLTLYWNLIGCRKT
jgi:hypothetical protein